MDPRRRSTIVTLTLLAGLWFVNLVNFMDGLDLMTIAEAVPVTAAVALLGWLGDAPAPAMIIAAALFGALLGFEIPLASVIAHSAGIIDLIVWGIVALVVQLAGFYVARLVLPHLPQAIADGNIADAVLLAGISLSLGILTAACMAG